MMQLGDVINVGLGLAFTFFLLSLIASAIQECIAGVFKWRGTYLAKALDVILSNDPNATFGWYGIGDWLTAHLSSRPGMTEADFKAKTGRAAGLFLRPVTLTPAAYAAREAARAAEAAARKPLDDLVAALHAHPLIKNVPTDLPAYISGKTFAMALLSLLRDGSQNSRFTQVATQINALPDGDFKATLNTFLLDAGHDLDKFRANIESWFDGAMDRLSGIYKRVSQYALLIIGFILAVALNVNALHLANNLWNMDPASLAALADIAAQAKAPVAQQTWSDISTNLHQLNGLGLPIGWPQAPDWQALRQPSYWPAHLQHFVGHHVAGWLVTTAAVSFGAPFWFDLIQKLVNLRSAGPKPGSADSATPN